MASLREVQETCLFIIELLKRWNMKTLMMMVALFLSTTLSANERKEYKQLDNNKYEVKIYNEWQGVEYLQQVGVLDKHDDKLVPCGLWVMYNPDGEIQARAMFIRGKRAWFEKDLGVRTIVMRNKRGYK